MINKTPTRHLANSLATTKFSADVEYKYALRHKEKIDNAFAEQIMNIVISEGLLNEAEWSINTSRIVHQPKDPIKIRCMALECKEIRPKLFKLLECKELLVKEEQSFGEERFEYEVSSSKHNIKIECDVTDSYSVAYITILDESKSIETFDALKLNVVTIFSESTIESFEWKLNRLQEEYDKMENRLNLYKTIPERT